MKKATSASQPERLILLLAMTAGLVVANNYYNQPLLHEIGSAFHAPDAHAALISTLTQVGYACGLFLLLPLGDMVERKKLILVMLGICAASLGLFASSPTLSFAVVIAFTVGFFSVVPQLLPPVAMQLANPARAGKAVGLVMGGLLLGISLSRFVGGVLGDYLGWRTVYGIAAALMLTLAAALYRTLPTLPPQYQGTYISLLGSMRGLVRRHSELAWISVVGAVQFAAFSLIWTTFAFHLATMPGNYPASVAGTFALIGAGGVIAAISAGHLTERIYPRLVLLVASLLMVCAFGFFTAAQTSLAWLVPGVLFMDMGMQISHVTSMTRVLALEPGARSRLNTIYMSIRFSGGAFGTVLGSVSWSFGGWTMVCGIGLALCLLATGLVTALPLRTDKSNG